MTLSQAILKCGGLKRFSNGYMREELSKIPKRLFKKNGMHIDKILINLEDYGFYFENSNKLLDNL